MMMQFTCETKALAAALAAVKPAVGSRSAIDALAGVRIVADIDGARLHASNMATSVRKTLAANVVGDLDALVSHAELVRITKLFAGAVTLAAHDNNGLTVSNGRRTVTLRGLRMEDFPRTSFDDDTVLLHARGSDLARVVERACLFASADQTRPILTGVLFDATSGGVAVCATDSYRLVITSDPLLTSGASEVQANVPADVLRACLRGMRKTVVASMGLRGSSHVVIHLPDVGETWEARLIEGSYPKYRDLLPDETATNTRVSVPRDELRDAFQAAAAVAVRNLPLRLAVNGDVRVGVVGVDSPSLTEHLSNATISACAEPLEIGLNAAFALDVAKAASDGDVELDFISPLRPLLVRDRVGHTEFLLMPIRLNV